MPASRMARPVGRVVGLFRYPVKSMGAEALAAVDVGWHGLAGDRRWGFLRNDAPRSGFPWFTLRQRADLSHYRPFFVDPDKPDASLTRVRTPTGGEFDVADPALGEELAPGGLRALKLDRGAFDTAPLSLISTQTIARLGALCNGALAVQRFRPNLLLDADSGHDDAAAFAEDAWVGGSLRIGSLRLRVDARDSRCVVITIDPVTTQRNLAVLRTVAAQRQGCLGVYASTQQPGRAAVGDAVWFEPS